MTSAPGLNEWFSAEQIRKAHHLRHKVVTQAMECGELPFEQRGRARYARSCDVRAWEEKRLCKPATTKRCKVVAGLADLL